MRICKCNQALIWVLVLMTIKLIRGLMRFIEIISRESNIEDDEQVAGTQNCECELIPTQGSFIFIYFEY